MSEQESEAREKEFTITVNAREETEPGPDISYDQVTKLAYPDLVGDENVIFEVTYRKGEDKKKEGTLVEGESVKLKNGMIFDVTPTNRS